MFFWCPLWLAEEVERTFNKDDFSSTYIYIWKKATTMNMFQWNPHKCWSETPQKSFVLPTDSASTVTPLPPCNMWAINRKDDWMLPGFCVAQIFFHLWIFCCSSHFHCSTAGGPRGRPSRTRPPPHKRLLGTRTPRAAEADPQGGVCEYMCYVPWCLYTHVRGH